MTRLALVDLADNSVIREVATAGWVELPNGSRVAPAVAGWRGGGAITYVKAGDSEQAVEGPPRFALVEIDGFAVPEGKRTVGATIFTLDAKTGKVVESAAVEDAIEEKLTADRKVAAMLTGYDLTLDELKAVLSGAGG
jgi:hypothetical protein